MHMLDLLPEEFDDSDKMDENGVPYKDATELRVKHRATGVIADVSRFPRESLASNNRQRTTVQGSMDPNDAEQDLINK